MNNNNKGECFIKGVQAFNLVTIKDFIYFYVKTLKGQISLNPIQLLVLNFIKRFFSDFKWLINTEINI